MTDITKTQHFSKDIELIDNLIQFVPKNACLIEPFAGSGSLIDIFPNHNWEAYDIDPKCSLAKEQDTLLNPPLYKDKWVITNPPYLAKNKASDLKVFYQYPDYDDLYKIAIHTILESEGGILIVPINFLADEKSKKIREKFFSNFTILQLNLFTTQMFENTTYNVCSFFFSRKVNNSTYIEIPTTIFPQKENFILSLSKDSDWRIGGDMLSELKKCKNIFNRLTMSKPNPENGYITNITIDCIDKEGQPLHFYYADEPYYGKDSDRSVASLVSSVELDANMQKNIIELANQLINDYRVKCNNMCFTNYRDRNRKRIGFKEAYSFASLAYNKIINNKKSDE